MQNYFEHQEVVTGRAKNLALLLTLTLAGTIITTAFFLTFACVPFIVRLTGEVPTVPILIFWFGGLVLTVGAAVISVSYFKVNELRAGGGAHVAENLGGTLVTDAEGRFDENSRRASNIVAEVAIAAGLPQPALYVLPGEHAVNAFAVGYSQEDAVIGLTQGAIQKLNREQLQGVVAHELSHIANGDMRDNIEIIGYLFGVVGISVVAENAMHMGWELCWPEGNRRANLGLGLLLIVTGSVLWVVGMMGLMCSSLFKAAISRQREFLADAAAVQYTRNPMGLADALRYIGGSQNGSRLVSARSLEASHLFFATGVRTLLSAFESHPPLVERIRRLDPQWDGEFPVVDTRSIVNPVHAGVMNLVGVAPQSVNVDAGKGAEPDGPTVKAVRDTLCVAEPAQEYLEAIKASLPELLVEVASESLGAEVCLLALWLTDASATEQEGFLCGLDEELRIAVNSLLPLLNGVDGAQKLFLFDIACNTIRGCTHEQLSTFVQVSRAVLDISVEDQHFRWAWQRTIANVLEQKGCDLGKAKPKPQKLNDALGPCEILLSAAAYCGSKGALAQYSFQRAGALIGSFDWVFRQPEECTLDILTAALAVVAQLTDEDRLAILLACGKAISSDGEINDDEACLLRGISCGLALPSPELLPGQPIAPGV